MLLSVFLGALLASSAAAAGALQQREVVHDRRFQPDYILRGTFDNNTQLACTTRPSVLLNGTHPAPELRLAENKTTWIRVFNDIPDQNLTVHWHGLSASVAPFSDGTPLVTQWPIPPGHFFDYELHPELHEAGTHFYHAHVGFQSVSAVGALIVGEANPADDPYAQYEEKIVMLTELYNKTDQTILSGLVANPFTWSGEPNQIMVNGNAYAPPYVDVTSTCGPEIFEVEPDKTYRFRVVAANALGLIVFEIENHRNMSIVAADAAYTQPYSVSRMQAGPGQRFDFLLKTMSKQELSHLNKTKFWIQLEDRLRPSSPLSYALLRYKQPCSDKPQDVPAMPAVRPLNITTDIAQITSWAEYALQPLTPNDCPSASEVTRRIVITTQQIWSSNTSNTTARWQQAGSSQWSEGDPRTPLSNVPYLVNIYKNGQAAVPSVQEAQKYGGWDPKTNTWPAAVGEVLEIVWVNLSNNKTGSGSFDAHPWHAHGGHYCDIGSGPGMYDPVANEQRLSGYSPVKRDTTYLYDYTLAGGFGAGAVNGWRAWRLRVEVAGVWMIHCHALQHMTMGMQTVWVMGDAAQIQAKIVPADGYLTNGTNVEAYTTYGGEAYGNSTWDPKVISWFHDG
ncbi:putative multi-copper oxidase [Coniochaeta sp. 2T2.1]|nr:putative multi-copper oxidase [Coniochaeta sp. 2T2.1]